MISRPTATLTLARRHQTSLRLALIGFSILTPVSAFAQALPTGGAYVAGSGTIASAGATTTITQSSARGVINWQGFSIGAGGTVQFNNGSGATLNRVTGSQMSAIQGRLGATGSVFLINPNGVVIGPKGTVVAGGSFVASTRDTPDSAFMKGNAVTLSGTSSGTVKNEGHITSTGGNVVLVGRSVTNGGTIEATGGTVALAAGDKVVLSEADGPDGIYVVADAKAKGDVTNTGRIRAAAATLASAGGNVYALAGNRQGLVQATGTKTVDGQVWLTAPNGSVTVDGTTATATNEDGSGGTIRANGGTVTVGGQATLSASAARPGAKGGRVLVGTDAPGGVNLARRTTIADGATVAATGKGGGKGGMIETSAHTLALGKASVNAGVGGSWLLDPDDLTIDTSAASTIDAALNAGTDVTEQTSSSTASNINGAGTSTSGSGDINVNAPLSWSGAGALTLSAYHSITLNAGITISGSGKLTLTTNNNAGGTSSSDGTVNFGTNAIQFTSPTITAATATGSNSPLTINGTPYTLVASATDLQGIGTTGNYALARPLDLSSFGTFTTIASNYATPFLGTFDGLGNTIAHLSINGGSNTYAGLFGLVGDGTGNGLGVVQNVGLVAATITSSSASFVGSLIGWNNGTVRNVYMTGSVSGANTVGGLVGHSSYYGTITNAYTAGTVSGSSTVGGMVGENDGTLNNAHATGNVTGTGAYDVGGLVGYNTGQLSNAYATGAVSGSGTIGGLIGQNQNFVSNAYATGSVTGSGTGIVGGLIGQNDSIISNIYATGTVSGSGAIGGLTGQNDGMISNAYATGAVSGSGTIGGLVGKNTTWVGSSGSISTAYASGTVSGSGTLGGVAGENDGTITNAYFDTTPSGLTLGVGGDGSSALMGLTTAQLASALPGGFDPSIWGNLNNQTTPYLLGFTANQQTLSGSNTVFGATAGAPVTVILSASGLRAIDSNLSRNYGLGNDIDATPLGNFNPLAESTPFTGIFYGANHTIANLTINDATDQYVGLFGQIGPTGTVTNVGLAGASVANTYSGYASVGGLVGYNNGTISNVFVSGTISSPGNGYSDSGGLAGDNAGTIRNAYATASVSAAGDYTYAGGLVGGNDATINNAYATGSVTATGSSSLVGGLVGENGATINNAYATGSVTATGGGSVGGLAGQSTGTITNAYFDTTTSGLTLGVGDGSSSSGITGLTTTQWASEGPTVAGSPYSFSTPGDWVSGSPYPVLRALPYVVITAQGSQTYGQNAVTFALTSILDQNNLDASGKVDATALTWSSTGLTSTSSAGSSVPLIGHGVTAPGYQIAYAGTDTVIKAALTITADGQSSTYGQTPSLDQGRFTTSGLVTANHDTVT
ncbi:filamentous hemagglutinin N-terminal domain-containing protein, partial [Gluconacetobacter aggeris]